MNRIDLLIIEDSEVDWHLIKRILHKENLTESYCWLKDGKEALDYFEDQDKPLPLVVLLDIKLPKVDGLQVLKSIKNNERTKMIPVVMYSSSYQKSDVLTAYQLGANSYLTKPSEFSEMKKQFVLFYNYWINFNKILKID